MLTKEKLLSTKTIVAHGDCPDGLASAMILKNVLHNAKVVFVSHSFKEQNIKIPKEEGLLFCDITPNKELSKYFAALGAIVLDHHEGVKKKNLMEPFGDFGIYENGPGISGATLAYKYVWKPLKERARTRQKFVENFAKLAGTLDTWQDTNPEWETAIAQGEALMFYKPEYWIENHHACLRDTELSFGVELFQHKKEKIQKSIERAYLTQISDINIGILQNNDKIINFTSKSIKVDLCIGFSFACHLDDLKMNLSLRSEGKFNCFKLAQYFGGNGHENAAGCSIRLTPTHQNPYHLIENLVAKYIKARN